MTQEIDKETSQRPDFNQPEIIRVTGDKVSCDGGGGPTGHPRVYLPIYANTGFVDCPYCDRRFISSDVETVHDIVPH